MNRSSFLMHGALLFGASLFSTAALAGQPLFLGEQAPSQRAAGVAASLARKPDTQGVRVMRADASVVSAATREIELDLGLKRVNAVLEQATDSGTGSLVWVGQIRETAKARPNLSREVRHDAANSAILVRRDGTVTGNVRVDGQLYRIRPLPDGGHAVVEVDESRMPADHPAEFADLPNITMDRPGTRAAGSGDFTAMAIDPGTTETIRILVAATNQAVTGYGGNMQALVELAVAESNQGYANSNVGINLVLAGYTTVTYTESGSFSTDLSRFRGTSDGYMDGIHATRDQLAADVALIVLNNSSSCGLASGIGSTASTAFASAYWDCITGYYSFAHEIGHLQSARHDPAADPTTTPYAYGHGYRAPNNAWRTVMAYACTGGCPRLNYWSNPDVTYGGVAMGTATQSHNQRVLVNTKATIANFRGTTGGGQTYSNGTDYAISDNSTVDSPITVSGRSGNAPSNASVTVAIVHTYQGDLKVDLVAPDGSLYNIHNRSGGSADNINKTVTLNLSSEPLNGTWKLRVNDNAAGDTGYINSWSVTF
jgi:hypothetical protein